MGTSFDDYTDEQIQRLLVVFDVVSVSASDWRNPIRVFVDKNSATKQEIEDAVLFYTGTEAEVTTKNGRWLVRAPGYYAGQTA